MAFFANAFHSTIIETNKFIDNSVEAAKVQFNVCEKVTQKVFHFTINETNKFIDNSVESVHTQYNVCHEITREILKTCMPPKPLAAIAQVVQTQEPHIETPQPIETHLHYLNYFLNEMINFQVALNWSKISYLIERELKPLLENMIETKVKYLKVTKFNLGKKPIKLNSFKWNFEKLNEQSFKFVFDFDVLFKSDCSISFKYFKILTVGASNLYLKGTVHVELVCSMPFNAGKLLSCGDSMLLYFHESPEIHYEFTQLGKALYWLSDWKLLNIEVVRNLIKRFIQDILVYPNTLGIKL